MCRITLYIISLFVTFFGMGQARASFHSSQLKVSKNEQIEQPSNFNWRIPKIKYISHLYLIVAGIKFYILLVKYMIHYTSIL